MLELTNVNVKSENCDGLYFILLASLGCGHLPESEGASVPWESTPFVRMREVVYFRSRGLLA